MNIWAIGCLVLLTFLIPTMAFFVGILVGAEQTPHDVRSIDMIGGWGIGTIGLAVTLANIILLLS